MFKALREKEEEEEKGADVNEDLEALQAQLAAQEHLYQVNKLYEKSVVLLSELDLFLFKTYNAS